MDKRKRLGAAGAVGGILLGAAAIGGTVLAQTGPGPNGASGTPSAAQQQRQAQRQAQQTQYLDDLAQNLGVDPSKLTSAISQTEQQLLAAAVQQGTITQAEATAVQADITAGKVPMSFGFDPAGMAGHAGISQITGLQTAIQNAFQQTAGETQQQFFTNVRAGKTPEQEFQAHNTSATAVSAAEVAAATPLLNSAVSAKTITQQQATDFLNQLQHGPGMGGPGGPGGHGGPGGPPAATPAAN